MFYLANRANLFVLFQNVDAWIVWIRWHLQLWRCLKTRYFTREKWDIYLGGLPERDIIMMVQVVRNVVMQNQDNKNHDDLALFLKIWLVLFLAVCACATVCRMPWHNSHIMVEQYQEQYVLDLLQDLRTSKLYTDLHNAAQVCMLNCVNNNCNILTDCVGGVASLGSREPSQQSRHDPTSRPRTPLF